MSSFCFKRKILHEASEGHWRPNCKCFFSQHKLTKVSANVHSYSCCLFNSNSRSRGIGDIETNFSLWSPNPCQCLKMGGWGCERNVSHSNSHNLVTWDTKRMFTSLRCGSALLFRGKSNQENLKILFLWSGRRACCFNAMKNIEKRRGINFKLYTVVIKSWLQIKVVEVGRA